MAERCGRCVNVEFCSIAVTRRIVCVSDGASFACERCSEPLEPTAATRVLAGRRLAAGLQVLVVLIFGAAIAYKFARPPETQPRQINTVAAIPANGPNSAIANTPEQASIPLPPPPIAAAEPLAVAGSSVSETARETTPSPRAEPAPAEPDRRTTVSDARAAPPLLAEVAPAPTAPPADTPAQSLTEPALPWPQAVPVVAAQATPPKSPAPTTVLLRIASSDPVASKLAGRLASGYLAMIGNSGIDSEADGPDRTLNVFGLQAGQRELIKIATPPAEDLFASLARGAADMAISFRAHAAMQTGGTQAAKPMTTRGTDVVVAVQGLGVVVSRSNPVTALTTDQLRGVLAGRIVNWSDLRGPNAPINLHLTETRAGFEDDFQAMLLLRGSTVREATRLATEAELTSAVADDPGGIGLIMAGNAGRARLLAVGKEGVPPVLPSNMALATEEYPLTRRLYLLPGRDGSNAFVRRFMGYVMSPAGQSAVEAAGFAILPLKAERIPTPEVGSDRLRQLLIDSTRVSAELRFYPGSVQLDTRSVRELERLVTFLRAERVSGERVILAGFTDNFGPPAANMAVSQRRAESITAALARYGIVPGEAIGFGSELPIGDNTTADGRERNRRVEVYLAP